MALDQHTYVGAFAYCSGPIYLGPRAPFDDWLEVDGKQALTKAENNTGPLVAGAASFLPNWDDLLEASQ